jgi:tRNA threonylcarbamoyladenosine biosynthesis protein TsaE
MHIEKILEKQIFDENDTKSFAAEAISNFHLNDIILLFGKIGSGKTFLVKEFVKLLGLTSETSSPSFALVNQYRGAIIVNHIDLYRITDRNQLYNLGLDDYLNSKAINFIEWPQLIEKYIQWQHFRIFIDTNTKLDSWRNIKLVRYLE